MEKCWSELVDSDPHQTKAGVGTSMFARGVKGRALGSLQLRPTKSATLQQPSKVACMTRNCDELLPTASM